MFSCALHNWFSYESPCPACQRQLTSGGDLLSSDGTEPIIINRAIYPCESCKQLQTTIEEREDEIEKITADKKQWCNKAMEAANQRIQLQSQLNYWKERCLAAEKLIDPADDFIEGRKFSLYQNWQSLKQKQP